MIDVDAIEEHRPVSRLRLLLLGGLVGAGFVVGGILFSSTPAHADDGLLGGVGGVVSGVTQPVSRVVDSIVDTAVPVVEDVTSVVPEPVAEIVQPVVEPVVDHVVVPVVEAVPDAPVAEIVQPVTDVVDPVIAAVPVVGDVLGSTPTSSVTAPVVELADSTVGQVTNTVVTVAPGLPGASEPTGPDGVIPSLPGVDLPGTSTVSPADTGDLLQASSPAVAALAVSSDGALPATAPGSAASSPSSGLPAPGQAGSASSSTPPVPSAPAPAGHPEGSPVVLPTPSGSGGAGTGGGAGSGGVASLDALSGSLFAHAAITLRALESDDALPASPTFDLGSTPD